MIEDLDQATEALSLVVDLGMLVSIDDLGAGWASLIYLRQLPVDALKIDGSFVAGLPDRARERTIVRSIISPGHELDLAVVAEGVETADQREALRDMGCRLGQGHLFARPQPAGQIDRSLGPPPPP